MRNPNKSQKRKSVVSSEPLGSAEIPAIPSTVAVAEAPPPVALEVPKKPVALSAKTLPPVTVQTPKPPRRSSRLKGLLLAILILVAFVVAGPSVLLIAGAFTYPLLILLACILVIAKISSRFQRS